MQPLAQKLKELQSLTDPYLISYRSGLLYYVALDNTLVQMCCVFHYNGVDFVHRELYSEPKGRLKIGIQRIDVNEVFTRFEEFAKSGEILIDGSLQRFISPATELVESRILDREHVAFGGREWSARGLVVRTSKTVKQMLTDFDFDRLSNILREEKGVYNVRQLVAGLGLPTELGFDYDQSALVYLFAPVFATINRCGLVREQAKVTIRIAKGLRKADCVYLNVLKFQPKSLPASSRVFPKDMTLAGEGKDSMFYLTHEFSVEQINRVDLDLKDHEGVSRSSDHLDVELIRRQGQYAKSLSRDAAKLLVKKIGRWTVPILAIALVLYFIYSVAQSVYPIWPGTEAFTVPTALATLAMAAVTFLLVIVSTWTAIISKRALKVSRFEQLKGMAEKAINEFLVPLKGAIEATAKDATLDRTATIFLDQLMPEPHLRPLTFEEDWRLPRQLSHLLRAISNYNSRVDADSEELNSLAEKLTSIIDGLISRLGKQYGASTRPPEDSGTIV